MAVRVSWFDYEDEITYDVEVYTDEARDRVVAEKIRRYGRDAVEVVGTVYSQR